MCHSSYGKNMEEIPVNSSQLLVISNFITFFHKHGLCFFAKSLHPTMHQPLIMWNKESY
jgi:hypothetical protein